MNIFSRFRPQQQPTAAPPLKFQTRTITAKVQSDNQLAFHAKSLDEFYQTSDLREQAQSFMRAAVEANSLRSQDGLAQDADERPGHVVLPDRGFEAHGDTFKREFGNRGETVEGDAQKIQVHQPNIYAGSLDEAHGNQSTWDLGNGNFSYAQESIHGYSPDQYNGSLDSDYANERLLAEETFPISTEGAIAKQNFHSLAEAREGEAWQRSQTAMRVEELIQSAALWQTQGQALDGQAGVDWNPESRVTVAPEVPVEKLAQTLAQDPVMTAAQQSVNYETLDLEASQHEFLVSGRTDFGARNILSGSTSENGDLQVTFKSLSDLRAEKVSWSKADGTVKYQKVMLEEPGVLNDLSDPY